MYFVMYHSSRHFLYLVVGFPTAEQFFSTNDQLVLINVMRLGKN